MEPEQVARRAARQKKQKQRKKAKAKTKRSQTSRGSAAEHARTPGHPSRSAAKYSTSSRSVAEHRKSSRSAAEHPGQPRRPRPCCGLRCDKCTCKPPPGLHQRPLNALAKRYLTTPLSTVGDTTDVSKFRRLMKERCQSLPIWVVLLYTFVHVVFNQEELLKAMLDKKAFLFKPPWVNWTRLKAIIRKAKQNEQKIRSSNYYSSTLKRVVPQTGHKPVEKPVDATERDVLTCRLVAHDSLPREVCYLYDANPTRDLWKAMLKEWLRQASLKSTGVLDHYYLKCCLDRLFAVRDIDHGTISWWPVQCPSYEYWYDTLYPNRCSRARFHEDEKFQILCAIYRKLNSTRGPSTFTEALAQTCWKMKEEKGRAADA